MKLFIDYVRLRKKTLVWLVLTVGIFVLVLFLCRLPLSPVLYALSLSAAVGLALAAVDLYQTAMKRKQLKQCQAMLPLCLEKLPPAENELEKTYQQLLCDLETARQEGVQEKERILRESSDYYTMWAHQIKTPIQAMRLLLQNETIDGEELQDQLFLIEQYVQMVLQYLKSENLSADMLLEEQPLDPLIKQAIRKVSRLFIRKRIALDFKLTEMIVVTDGKWLVFVLEQLLLNALKYTPSGTVTIWRHGTELVLEDTGIGIRSEDLPRLCERGFTGFNGHQDKKSTGIGLYLCKKILTRLGFRIRFESVVNQGTRVFLDLAQPNRSLPY